MLTKTNNRVMLSDTSYVVGKKLVQIYLPALSSLYFALAAIWDLPGAEKVVGTIACITTFMGVSLGISSKSYDASGAALVDLGKAMKKNADGALVVTTDEDGKKTVTFDLGDSDPYEIADKNFVSFKVRQE